MKKNDKIEISLNARCTSRFPDASMENGTFFCQCDICIKELKKLEYERNQARVEAYKARVNAAMIDYLNKQKKSSQQKL